MITLLTFLAAVTLLVAVAVYLIREVIKYEKQYNIFMNNTNDKKLSHDNSITDDGITTILEITLSDGDRFSTCFSILLTMLADKSIQKIVDDYYVGTDYTFTLSNYQREITRKIVKVEILEIKK